MCAKENTQQKETIHLIDPRALQNSSGNNLLNSRHLKTCQFHQMRIQFSRNPQCQVLTYILHFIEILSFIPSL